MTSSGSGLSLRECAERLGVHYMTVYRYVRTGMLPARKDRSTWVVDAAALTAFRSADTPRASARNAAPWDVRFREVCMRGDDLGAWRVVESALAGGMSPEQVYLGVISPALRAVGDLWAEGVVGVAQEHAVTGVALRTIGRLGPLFRSPGRRKGTILLAAPQGERHGVGVAMTADLLRSRGWEAIDLGADLPASDIADAAVAAGDDVIVGLSVTVPEHLDAAEETIAAIRERGPRTIVVGGAAFRDDDAGSIGADIWAPDGLRAADLLAR